MSSLRLALKQSLAETSKFAHQDDKDDRKLRDKDKRRRKRSKQAMKNILSQKDRSRKLKANKIKLETMNDRRGTGIHVNSSKRSVSSSTLSSSDSDSDSSSCSSNESSDCSHSDSHDSESLHSCHDEASLDEKSLSDDSQTQHITMEGVFDSEVSCDDEDASMRKVKKMKKKKNRLKVRRKRMKAESSVTSSHSNKNPACSDSDSRLKHKKRPLSIGSQNSSSKKPIQSSSNSNRQQTVDPPSNQTIVWMRGMSSGKQRRKVAAGLRIKVRFTTKSSQRDEEGKTIKILNWYGGVISDVGSGGKKIRIKYDDGTSEISDFPDKDIVVDSEGNGHHRVSADAFIPPIMIPMLHMLPTRPRSISPIISISNKITSLDKQETRNLLSNESKSSPITTSKTPSQDAPPKCSTDYYVNVDRVQTPVQTSDCFTSSNQSLSGLKSSTVSESPISVTHDRCTVTSSGISGCSDSSVCFDHTEGTDVTTEKEPMIINSQTKLARKRSRSSSPRRPNYIPKLNSNLEDGDSDTHIQGKMSKNKKSRGTSLKIKLSSIKKKNSFNSVENTVTHVHTDSSESESEIQKPFSSKGTKKVIHVTEHSRQISGDETDAYIPKGKMTALAKGVEADREWMGDDEGQGQNFVKHSRKSNTMTCHQNSSDHKIDSGYSSKSLGRSRKDSDLDSETSLEANTKAKSLGIVIRNLQQSKATAFTKYVKKGSSSEINESFALPSGEIQKIGPGGLGNESDGHMSRSEPKESFIQSGKGIKKPFLKADYPDTDIPNTQSQRAHQKLSDDSFGFVPDTQSEIKQSFSRSEKKRRRKHRSRSSSPHPSRELSTSKVLSNVNSINPHNEKTGISHIGSSILGTSSFQNSDSIVMAMQLQNQDNLMSKEASDIVENNNNDGNNERDTAVSTEASLTDDDASKIRMSITSNEIVNDDGQTSSIEPSKPGRRIGSKGGKRVSTKGENQTDDVNKSSKKKSKQKGKRKAYRKLRRRDAGDDGGGSGDEDDEKNDENWVQCDRCHKWRLLPNSVSADSLPERWYCELNYYDNKYNSCEAPQQSEQSSPQRGSVESEVDSFKNNASEFNSRLNTKELIAEMQSTSVESFDSFDSQDGNKSFSRKSGTRIDENGFDETENTDDGQSDVSNLNVSNAKSSSKRNRGRKEDDREKKSTRGKKKKEAKNQEWVQCEKCHKWRKLPLSIQAKDLPDVWYCTMNTWDPRSASCAVAEEEIDNNENERQFTILGSGKGPFSSLNGNGSKLSYRSLIFGGGNGRSRNRPISERTRAAESIFSSQIMDEDSESPKPPTVMYANSSAFYYRGGINSQRTNPEEKNTESFLDMMSHSSLWEDLSQGAQIMQNMSLAEQSPPVNNDLFTDMSKDDYIRAMKAMLYYALGSKTLEDHEILFEAQCREWDDYRWSNLRALCTIDVVTKFLEALIEDGLVETRIEESASGFQILRYRRAPFDLSNATNHESINEPSSRCMKISKPWKNT